MFASTLNIRYLCVGLLNRINKNHIIIQNIGFIRHQTQLNLKENVSNSFDQFSITHETQTRLKARGIESLFPVQSLSFNEIIAGNDCIVQARTGTGKTLAFSLPIIERLQKETSNRMGRFPRCLVLEPTRELAKQITNDFLSIKSRFLAISTLYGGKQYSQQELSLKRGSDIVVGTPGRIKDFLNQNKLNLQQCQIIVLDEVDRMLDMGFQDDVDFIIKKVYETKGKCQMIVFSATIPIWLKKTLQRYMTLTDKSHINLIENSKEKTSLNIQHLSLKINNNNEIPKIVLKLFQTYCQNRTQSQSIVFCQTKAECDQLNRSDELGSLSSDVLHGNLSQRKREQVLHNFRQGNIRVLITTDVAARGLDIPQVDLVILTSPPQDWESYIHRSGRTARAGKDGTAITLYNYQQFKQIKNIQQNANIRFQNVDLKKIDIYSENISIN